MSQEFSDIIPELLTHHLDILLKLGISIEIIRERGYQSLTSPSQLEYLGFSQAQRQAPALLIPLYAPDGVRFGYQSRPDNPRLNKKDKPVKYETPQGASIHLDMPPFCSRYALDPGIDLWFTEGAKKADALASHGLCSINLTGVWGFKGRNVFGGITLLAEFDLVSLNNRNVFIAYDSDIVTKHEVYRAMKQLKVHLERKGAHVQIIYLPLIEGLSKTGVDDYLAAGHTIDDLRQLTAGSEGEDDTPLVRSKQKHKYVVDDNELCRVRSTKDNAEYLEPLCTLVPYIAEQICRDNGSEVTNSYIVGGKHGSHQFKEIEVAASDFGTLKWLEEWGGKADIYPGANNREHIRSYMKMQIKDGKPRHIFEHTGWREINDERAFLTASGALNKQGIEVDLRGKGRMDQYMLPTDLNTISPKDAMSVSVKFMDIGNPEVMVPLGAIMYSAPLCEIMEPNFITWIEGRTGELKSSITALALCHFGEFTYKSLPVEWAWSTAMSMAELCFYAKDVPLVVDNWLPGNSRDEQKTMDKLAHRFIHYIGDRAYRGRFGGNNTPPPRGCVISTGEQLPDVESTQGRLLVLQPKKDDINLEDLSLAQSKDAFTYPYAMGHYIAWIGKRYESLKTELPDKLSEYRKKAAGHDIHKRLPEAVAHLFIGLELGLTFALETGAIDEAQFQRRLGEGWNIFCELAARQSRGMISQRSAYRFVEALQSLKEQERLLFIDRNFTHFSEIIETQGVYSQSKELKPNQIWAGWEDDEFLYLLPDITFKTLNEYCLRGDGVPLGKKHAVLSDLRQSGITDCHKDSSKTTGFRNSNIVRVGSDPDNPDNFAKRVNVIKVIKSKLNNDPESDFLSEE